MSRGHGRVQQHILDALAEGETVLTTDAAARRVFGTDSPTRSHLVSVRRAMHRLDDAGLISIGGLSAGLVGRPSAIYAAPPLSEEQLAKDRAADLRIGALFASSSGPYRKSHPFVCCQCGVEFLVDTIAIGRGKKWCSDACRQLAYRQRVKPRHL